MFVFIPGSIPPVRFRPGGTDPAKISISPVTYIYEYQLSHSTLKKARIDLFYLFKAKQPIDVSKCVSVQRGEMLLLVLLNFSPVNFVKKHIENSFRGIFNS